MNKRLKPNIRFIKIKYMILKGELKNQEEEL